MSVATYGGWFTSQPESTGSSISTSKASRIIMAAVLAVGTGGAINSQMLHEHQLDSSVSRASKVPSVGLAQVRSPAEDLGRVREVFSPAMSDLAKALDVSRQAVYNWVREEQQPKPEHIAKLRDFAQAADTVADAGVTVTGTLLKRKLMDGKNLFEVGQSGGSIREVAHLLIQLVQHETEQRERMAARFAERGRGSRSEESDFPAENDVS